MTAIDELTKYYRLMREAVFFTAENLFINLLILLITVITPGLVILAAKDNHLFDYSGSAFLLVTVIFRYFMPIVCWTAFALLWLRFSITRLSPTSLDVPHLSGSFAFIVLMILVIIFYIVFGIFRDTLTDNFFASSAIRLALAYLLAPFLLTLPHVALGNLNRWKNLRRFLIKASVYSRISLIIMASPIEFASYLGNTRGNIGFSNVFWIYLKTIPVSLCISLILAYISRVYIDINGDNISDTFR
jgi:hypothetical protein